MLTTTSRCYRILLTLVVFAALFEQARAEDHHEELVPELNVFIKLNKQIRLYLLGDVTQGLSPSFTDGELGAHIDLTLKPILRRELRQGDWERSRYLWVRAGYVVSRDLDDREDGSTAHTIPSGNDDTVGVACADLAGEPGAGGFPRHRWRDLSALPPAGWDRAGVHGMRCRDGSLCPG